MVGEVTSHLVSASMPTLVAKSPKASPGSLWSLHCTSSGSKVESMFSHFTLFWYVKASRVRSGEPPTQICQRREEAH